MIDLIEHYNNNVIMIEQWLLVYCTEITSIFKQNINCSHYNHLTQNYKNILSKKI